MGGTSIWMSRSGPHHKYSRLVRSGTRLVRIDHQARCWVLRERLCRTFGSGPCLRRTDAGGGTARTLRTAQWTRASCWSSDQHLSLRDRKIEQKLPK